MAGFFGSKYSEPNFAWIFSPWGGPGLSEDHEPIDMQDMAFAMGFLILRSRNREFPHRPLYFSTHYHGFLAS